MPVNVHPHDLLIDGQPRLIFRQASDQLDLMIVMGIVVENGIDPLIVPRGNVTPLMFIEPIGLMLKLAIDPMLPPKPLAPTPPPVPRQRSLSQ